MGASKPWSVFVLVLVSSGSSWQPLSMSPQVLTAFTPPPMAPTPPWSTKKSEKPSTALAESESSMARSRAGG